MVLLVPVMLVMDTVGVTVDIAVEGGHPVSRGEPTGLQTLTGHGNAAARRRRSLCITYVLPSRDESDRRESRTRQLYRPRASGRGRQVTRSANRVRPTWRGVTGR